MPCAFCNSGVEKRGLALLMYLPILKQVHTYFLNPDDVILQLVRTQKRKLRIRSGVALGRVGVFLKSRIVYKYLHETFYMRKKQIMEREKFGLFSLGQNLISCEGKKLMAYLNYFSELVMKRRCMRKISFIFNETSLMKIFFFFIFLIFLGRVKRNTEK